MKNSLKRKSKVTILFFLITLLFLAFIFRIFYIALNPNYSLPSLYTSTINQAVRGNIISKDGFTISTSKKRYFAEIDTRNLNPEKRNLFIKLFSIYTDLSEEDIKKSINSNFGYVRLSYNIEEKKAKYLKVLARELLKRDVFIEYVNLQKGLRFLHGLQVLENEEFRYFPYRDVLTPVIGYMNKREVKSIIKPFPIKGLEYYYRDKLAPIRDAKIEGQRDVASNIIYNKKTKVINRLDGYNLYLTINLELQKAVEGIIDDYKKRFQAKEILVSIMDSDTGDILTLATTRRFNPNSISHKDLEALNVSAIEYTFEPGSVMKPITYSILLREKKIKPNDIFNTYHGVLKIGEERVTDSHKLPTYITAENAIVYSSNVVLAQMAQKLTPLEFYNGFRDFGFTTSSNIDLPYEHIGKMPSLSQFHSKIYRASLSYGYSIEVNFMQLMRAYAVFNNGGYLVTPHLGDYLQSPTNDIERLKREKIRILDKKSALLTKKALIKTVQKGTGKKAFTEGYEIGGKTGTAHIVKKREYEDIYNSSFFGFANDKKHKYTIGVTVINPSKENYYASQSAVPIFKYIVDIMIFNGYLN